MPIDHLSPVALDRKGTMVNRAVREILNRDDSERNDSVESRLTTKSERDKEANTNSPDLPTIKNRKDALNNSSLNRTKTSGWTMGSDKKPIRRMATKSE